MKDRFNRFMQGRYGMDQMGRFMIMASMVLVVLSIVLTRWFRISSILSMLGFAGVIYAYYRMFSRDFAKRSEENRTFLGYEAKVKRFFGRQKYMMNERKVNHIYSCPGCGQKIRIPKGKGKIEIVCPKCKTTFIKKS